MTDIDGAGTARSSIDDVIKRARELDAKATTGPWEFRATEHSGGIKFVVAPRAPRNANGTEFIPADCSHGFNGRFIAFAPGSEHPDYSILK